MFTYNYYQNACFWLVNVNLLEVILLLFHNYKGKSKTFSVIVDELCVWIGVLQV